MPTTCRVVWSEGSGRFAAHRKRSSAVNQRREIEEPTGAKDPPILAGWGEGIREGKGEGGELARVAVASTRRRAATPTHVATPPAFARRCR